MVNESEIAQFRDRGLEPVGRIHGQQGLPTAHKKQSALLLKSIMKSVPKQRKGPTRKKISKGRGRSIERDMSVHITQKKLYW